MPPTKGKGKKAGKLFYKTIDWKTKKANCSLHIFIATSSTRKKKLLVETLAVETITEISTTTNKENLKTDKLINDNFSRWYSSNMY